MNERAPSRPAMLILAAIFLFEAWFWQGCVALGRRIAALIPLTALKTGLKRLIDRLPAPLALVVFVIPLAIVEPLQTICVILMARGHFLIGLVGFIALKFLGLGLIAMLFDMMREKLLSMPWFAWVYSKFAAFNAFAHALVAPYKAILVQEIGALRARARAYWARLRARANAT